MEELEQPDVVGLFAEVLLQEEVDGCLEHKCIVDRDVADAFYAVPAGLSTSSDALVHHIVRDQEVRLELSHRSLSSLQQTWQVCTHQLDTPAEKSGMEILCLAELGSFEDFYRVNNGHSAIELA